MHRRAAIEQTAEIRQPSRRNRRRNHVERGTIETEQDDAGTGDRLSGSIEDRAVDVGAAVRRRPARNQTGTTIDATVAIVNRIATVARWRGRAATRANPSNRNTTVAAANAVAAYTIPGNARASSAFCRPDAWSHVITAAVPLSAAALHVSRRRLIHPGDDRLDERNLPEDVQRVRHDGDVQAIRHRRSR